LAINKSEEQVFEGFPESGLRFLKGLAKNNDRAWFNERKTIYLEQVQQPLHALVAAVNDELRAKRIPFASDPRRLSFRIYRDTRFSNDKSPYKTHASAVLHRHGDRNAPGVLYLHIDPVEPFLAAGFHQPDSPQLRALRAAIARDPKAFRALASKLERVGLALGGEDDALSRLPRGFEDVDPSVAEYIKRKSFVVSERLTLPDLKSGALVQRVVTFAKNAMPLLEWGWPVSS
jgi:uncharacterized protein (TIGR02453 family)